MFNPAKEASAWVQRVAMMLKSQTEDLDSYASAVGGLICERLDHQQEMVELACRLTDVRNDLRSANTRAAKNAALALLAFGLIAVEIHAVVLYFLPK